MNQCLLPLGLLVSLIAGRSASAADNIPAHLEIDSGSASFEVATNVPGIEVKGKTNTLSAHARVEHGPEGMTLQEMEAVIPVKSLSTGMKLRDEHMQKYIFTTADGKTPDLNFSAGKGFCKPGRTAREFSCQIPGTLSIRGASRPVSMTLQAKEIGGPAPSYRAVADLTIQLTDFKIEPPSQFGVKPANQVKLHFDFTAREKSGAMAANRGER